MRAEVNRRRIVFFVMQMPVLRHNERKIYYRLARCFDQPMVGSLSFNLLGKRSGC